MQQFVTSSAEVQRRFKGEDVHGGPPLAFVEGGRGGPAHYLGILHFFQVGGRGRMAGG